MLSTAWFNAFSFVERNFCTHADEKLVGKSTQLFMQAYLKLNEEARCYFRMLFSFLTELVKLTPALVHRKW